ncbi:hypothetical protein UFOVP129_86 [uncultured Caudovirales phage]|uniref:Uncharacterized protein n=1 Tax=uncultured Caudovirales phage TaxID=2100421 RepID=A0A6J5LER5_9CAUD|nr:hypothetical protein UFOVP129_86 [uncultured Caudovirales phage]
MRTTKVFSVKVGNIVVDKENNYIGLYNEQMRCIASNLTEEENYAFGRKLYQLPQSLIRTPKSDEELAEEMYKDYEFSQIKTRGIFHDDRLRELDKSTFLSGRKSFGDKEFHLSEEELIVMIDDLLLHADKLHDAVNNENTDWNGENLLPFLIASLNPPIYPYTITVEHDGDNYLWETLKAEYE